MWVPKSALANTSTVNTVVLVASIVFTDGTTVNDAVCASADVANPAHRIAPKAVVDFIWFLPLSLLFSSLLVQHGVSHAPIAQITRIRGEFERRSEELIWETAQDQRVKRQFFFPLRIAMMDPWRR